MDCLYGELNGPGPIDELRLTESVDGVMERRIEAPVDNSGWLCCWTSGGSELRGAPSKSSGLGSSEGGGRTGNNAAFRYSFPSWLSSDCTCHSVERRTWHHD